MPKVDTMILKPLAMMLTAAVLAGAIPSSAEAAEIKRVRCRVDSNPAGVQVSVDVRDVDVAAIDVTISNQGSSEFAQGLIPNIEGDVEVEWDSDIDPTDPAEGVRLEIAADFAAIGDDVTASATGAEPRTVECKAK